MFLYSLSLYFFILTIIIYNLTFWVFLFWHCVVTLLWQQHLSLITVMFLFYLCSPRNHVVCTQTIYLKHLYNSPQPLVIYTSYITLSVIYVTTFYVYFKLSQHQMMTDLPQWNQVCFYIIQMACQSSARYLECTVFNIKYLKLTFCWHFLYYAMPILQQLATCY